MITSQLQRVVSLFPKLTVEGIHIGKENNNLLSYIHILGSHFYCFKVLIKYISLSSVPNDYLLFIFFRPVLEHGTDCWTPV